MEKAINSILNGIEQIPKVANPGTLITFESNAYPILIGSSETDIVFGAAEVGDGKIFVTTHELYLDFFIKNSIEFGKLWFNIKSWLCNGMVIKNEDIRNIDEFDSIMDIPTDVKLLKWIGTCHKSDLFINQLLKKFVMNGGNIICGVCPWGWLSISHGKTLNEMSLNKFLSLCGICFTSDLCSVESRCFKVNKDLNYISKSHFGYSINLLANDITQSIKVEKIITSGIQYLPFDIASKHLEKLQKILYAYICARYKPTSKTSVTCAIGRSLLTITSKVYQMFSSCGLRPVRAPNIDEFPGTYDYLNYPQSTNAIVSVKSKFDEFHCTGYYLAAGSLVRCLVVEGNPNGWFVRVGSHTDDLSPMPLLNRWPLVCSTIKLKRDINITSAFGGLIYLESPKGNSSIKIKLENVIEAPYYDLKKLDTKLKWEKNAKSPGLWAELCGNHITFTVPSDMIRNIVDPSEALKLWDQFVLANHELRGTDPFNTWRERVVVDIQPYGGSIHAGYPVTLSIESVKSQNLFEPQWIKANGWNIVHELAHNMQRSCWTPQGTEEVTVNIFTLHGFDVVFKEKPFVNRVLKQKLNEKVLDVLNSNSYSTQDFFENPYLGLFMYAQLINSFGWNSFKTIFREYESLNDKEKIFKSDTDKWDQWICRLSNIVGLDVSPLFYFWSVPFSAKPGTNLSDLTPWLPDDDITRLYKKRVDHVKQNYTGLLIGNESQYSNCTKMIYSDSSSDIND